VACWRWFHWCGSTESELEQDLESWKASFEIFPTGVTGVLS
jgi:hypothetical protein